MVQERRLIDILIIPLLIGLVIAIIQFGLPKIFAEDKELSYTIDSPIKYIDSQEINDVEVEVIINGEPVKSLYVYKIKIWNSGDLPIKDLPISLIFDDVEDFKIITTMHDTIPKYEFGYINETRGNYSIRLVFALLNPGDADTVTIISNRLSDLNLYTKSEGLSLKLSKNISPSQITDIIMPIFAILISLISIYLREFLSLRKRSDSLIKERESDEILRIRKSEADNRDSNLNKKD